MNLPLRVKSFFDEEYLEEQTDIVTPKFENEDGKGLIGPGLMVRNLMNFSKYMSITGMIR